MNTKNQLALAWTLVAVLATALIISLLFLLTPKKELGTVLSEGQETLTEQRETIAEACRNEDTANAQACQEALNGLSDLLKEFSQDLQRHVPAQTR